MSALAQREAPLEDPRALPPSWRPAGRWSVVDRRMRALVPLGAALSLWYFAWLLTPSRVGNPWLYFLLVAAELFNFVQAAGFWWTCLRGRDRNPAPRWRGGEAMVDILIPVFNEPLDVVAPTVRAAAALGGARVTVLLLDDAGRADLAELAAATGARHVTRRGNAGAKAGNLNHGLGLSRSPFVAVFDCDHVPDRRFLDETLGWMQDKRIAFVQTPQYYANKGAGRLAAAAASQQALFFGGIARGKDGLGAMFCCGTNVLFRRSALVDAGGFPEGSLTEDFELSIVLHSRGWRSAYVNEVLAQGLGPEDMASYVSQQTRWARGCLASLPTALAAPLPWRQRAQYLLSSMFFLSGWTFCLYMVLPALRIFFGIQPLAGSTADQFLVHFAPYFAVGVLTVAVAGGGSYTFDAFALMVSSFSVHMLSSVLVLARRSGRFVVTAKRGSPGPQPLAVAPALGMIALLACAVCYALSQSLTAAVANNVAFAAVHVCVLSVGSWPALFGGVRGAIGVSGAGAGRRHRDLPRGRARGPRSTTAG